MTDEPRYSPTLLALAAALTTPRWDDRADIIGFDEVWSWPDTYPAPAVWAPRPTLLDSASTPTLDWAAPDVVGTSYASFLAEMHGYGYGTATTSLTSSLVAEYRTGRPFFDGL